MALRFKRGLGAVNWLGQACVSGVDFGCPAPSGWVSFFGMQQSTVAPPPAPTGAVLTVPPASGTDAQATVDSLVNQQLVDQQALNATAVTSDWWDELTGGTYAAASGAVNSLMAALPWLIGGGLLLMFASGSFGGGSARRYGR